MKIVTRDEVRQAMDRGGDVAIVDALAPEAYAEGHLPNAVNIPVDRIDTLAPRMLKDKAQPIITYCASESCPASRKAAERLEDLGYTNVSAYEAGKEDWKKAGFPFVQGAPAQAA